VAKFATELFGETFLSGHVQTEQYQKLPPQKDHYLPPTPTIEEEDIKKLIPRSRINIVEGAGVYIDRVMPKESAETILAFLKNPGI